MAAMLTINSIDMALLGQSLIGVDRAIHKGVWAAMYPERARGRKRAEFTVKVVAPRAACVEISGQLDGAMGVLPFVYQMATSLGADFVKHLLSAAVFRHGGRPDEAESHMKAMIDILGESIRSSAIDRADEREVYERMHAKSLDAVVAVVDKLAPQAKQIVAPIGRTAEVLQISGGTSSSVTEIDVAVADAVRSNGNLIVGDMENFKIRFDAQFKHNRTAKVELVDVSSQLVFADIRDPLFDDFPNVYSVSYSDQTILNVVGKATRKDDEIVKLHIFSVVS